MFLGLPESPSRSLTCFVGCVLQTATLGVARKCADGTTLRPQICTRTATGSRVCAATSCEEVTSGQNRQVSLGQGMIELGGTIGDIESMPFIEALRQLKFNLPETPDFSSALARPEIRCALRSLSCEHAQTNLRNSLAWCHCSYIPFFICIHAFGVWGMGRCPEGLYGHEVAKKRQRCLQ